MNQVESPPDLHGSHLLHPMADCAHLVDHALVDKSNRTKFTLIFSNVSEKDILLREEFDHWAKKYPDNLKVVYYVDKGDKVSEALSSFESIRMTHGTASLRDCGTYRGCRSQ